MSDRHKYQSRNGNQGAKSKSRKLGSMNGQRPVEIPRIAPSVMNCIDNILVHESEWASSAKGMGLNRLKILRPKRNLSC